MAASGATWSYRPGCEAASDSGLVLDAAGELHASQELVWWPDLEFPPSWTLRQLAEFAILNGCRIEITLREVGGGDGN